MSHECPECYELCFCNGDIDDCCLNEDEAVNRCIHCPIDAPYLDELDDPDSDFWDDGSDGYPGPGAE